MKKNKGKKLGLTTWIFIALLAGLLPGLFSTILFQAVTLKIQLLSTAFFMCLEMDFSGLCRCWSFPWCSAL